MSLKIDRVQLEFMINNDPARKKIHEIDKQIDDLNRNLKGLKKKSEEYANTKNKIKELRLEQDKVRDSIGISNMTMKELIKTQKSINSLLTQLRPGTKEYEDLEKQAAAVNNRMKELKDNSKGVQQQLNAVHSGKGGFLTVLKGVFAGNLLTKGAMMLADLANKARAFVKEGVEMAAAAQGIDFAFNRIANRDYLNDLRRQTKGLVSDLTLMKLAVRAENFDIPLKQLGRLLEFAQNRARDTGESVEYLSESIIMGIGRRSPLILDNLGISAVRLREEVKKTGDMATAVGNIIEEEMSEAGEVIDTAADAATRKKVAWENLQLATGNFFVKFRSGWDDFTARFAEGLTKILQGSEEAVKAYDDQIKKVASLDMSVASLADRYDVLIEKGIENKEEQREIDKIMNDLLLVVPEARGEFDEYGNSLTINTEKVREYIAAERERIAVLREAALEEAKANVERYKELTERARAEVAQGGKARQVTSGRNVVITELVVDESTLSQSIADLNKYGQEYEDWQKKLDNLSGATYERETAARYQFNQKTKEQLKEWIEDEENAKSEFLTIAKEVYNSKKELDEATTENKKGTKVAAADPFKEELDALKRSQQEEILVLKQSLLEKEVTEDEFRKISFQKEIEHLEKMKLLYEEYDQDTIDLEVQLTDKLIAEANRRYKLAQDIQKQALDNLKKRPGEEAKPEDDDNWEATSYKDRKTVLDIQLKNEMITEEEHQEALFQLRKEYLDKYLDIAYQASEGIANISNDMSGAMANFQRSEEMSVERKYDKMIKAAGNNSRQVAKLEEEKEKKLNEIRAKYADKQFIVTVAQVISSTAVSAMEAYKAMAGIPVVGPTLGAIAAAAAVAFGESQIAVAKQQRDAAKAGYQTGGYTGIGRDDEEAGVVHRNEFVNTADAVRNPHVKRFLDVFNVAQKDGTIRMLNTSQILERARLDAATTPRQAVYSAPTPTNDLAQVETLNQLKESINRFTEKLNDPIQTYTVIHGQNGARKRNEMYDRIMRNARL